MSTYDVMCLCNGDVKCPHSLHIKIPPQFDEIEKTIDGVLEQFDRKSIKKFIKGGDSLKNKGIKSQSTGSILEQKDHSDDMVFIVEASRPSSSDQLQNPGNSRMMTSSNNNNNNSNKIAERPSTSISGQKTLMHSASAPMSLFSKSTNDAQGFFPQIGGSQHIILDGGDNYNYNTISENNAGYGSQDDDDNLSVGGGLSNEQNIEFNFANGIFDNSQQSKNRANSTAPNNKDANSFIDNNSTTVHLVTSTMGDSLLKVGLNRMADNLVRKSLPWQAVCCPRAVEQMRDIRFSLSLQKHNIFIQKMVGQLEGRVFEFLSKKADEVDQWVRSETTSWEQGQQSEDRTITGFLNDDTKRINDKNTFLENARLSRDIKEDNSVDDGERDAAREQLVKFRRLCQSDTHQNTDVRVLHASIETAKTKATANLDMNSRELVKRLEEAHEWLCCLADNAITAAESEIMLKDVFIGLDNERSRGLAALTGAITTYSEQQAIIIEAISSFVGRIRRYNADFLSREQLVGKAYIQYLINTLQNEVKVNSSQSKKSEIAWQSKHLIDRAHAKDQQLLVEFNLSVQKFEKIVLDLKEKLRMQAEEVKNKLQSVLNGRDNDVTRRKAVIHKKLGAHVNVMCQRRRLKLKLFKEQKKDELDIENRCIVLCSSFLQDLRSAIDSTWVRENLRERRMNEAARGRMERLEKSALVIWNKHSHLAIESKEGCEEWMSMYLQERQSATDERKSEIERDYKQYRKTFGKALKNFTAEIRPAVYNYVKQSCAYNISDPVEKNFEDLMIATQRLGNNFIKIQDAMRKSLVDYIETENINAKNVSSRRRNHLLLSWRGHLNTLNDALNKRIHNLKDMEKELEETVRLTIAQNEVESSVFEQTSCSRLEQFWLDYRSKFSTLSRDIQENYEDYLVVKERKMNDKGVAAKKTIGDLEDEIRINEPKKKAMAKLSDTQRIKIILDEVRNEHYGNFLMKVTRGLEQLKTEIGEGPKRFLPGYMVLKVLFAASDLFWDASNLSEKVIGKMYRRGHVVQFDANLGELPTNGRALFCIGTSFSILANISLNYGLIDCNDILQNLQKGLKRVFLPGMVMICQQFGGYGEALIKAECIWACSTCKVKPPFDLIENFRDVFHSYEQTSYASWSVDEKEANKMKFQSNSYLKDLKMAGFYSSDPVDLVNSVLSIPVPANVFESMSEKIDITSSMGTRNPYKKPSKKEPAPNPEIEKHAQLHAQYAKEQEERQKQKKKLLVNDIEEEVDLQTMLNRMVSILPVADITILVAALGRPDSKFEISPHIFVQAVSLWRKAAIAITSCALDPPGIDYIRATDLLSEHTAAIAGKRRVGSSNLVCMSPFGAVSNYIDWLTSVRGMPISIIQALCMLTKAGAVDPWLEDPKQSNRGARFIYEITEFIEVLFTCRYFKSTDLKGMRAVVPAKIQDIIKNFDVNGSCQVPLELLRNFIQKDTGDMINNQITAAYYSVCRNKIQEMFEMKQEEDREQAALEEDQADDLTVDSGIKDVMEDQGSYLGKPLKTVRDVVATDFDGDNSSYMSNFAEDVRKFLESMPSLDTSVVIGILHGPLEPSAAHELVNDAVKLDASARNSMPPSCAIWMGSGLLESEQAIKVVSAPGSIDETTGEIGIILGVGSSYHKHKDNLHARRLSELKTLIELDFLAKYPILSEQKSADEFYGASGGKSFSQEDHWKELLSRRLGRIDKLTLAWRDTMLNEWANSMYSSRRERYEARAKVIKECVKVYHKQYVNLRVSMIQSRENVLHTYPILHNDMMEFWKKEREFISFHSSFLDRLLRSLSSNVDRAIQIVKECMIEFQKHCGAIKRRAHSRFIRAKEILAEDMDRSCQSLITGYTGGFAQKFFDDLMQRGETLRQSITDLHGVIILEKEKFVYFKDELERELTFTIADKISLDRARTKSLLDSLAIDTAAIQEALAELRNKYSTIQKDSNARLIIRIEKSVREVRKLRTAAEQNPDIEKQVFSEIRVILSKAKLVCHEIVKQITEESENILANIDPMRAPHRAKMEKKVAQFISGWTEVEKGLLPLIENYQLECGKEIKQLVSKCRTSIETFRDAEIRKLSVEFLKARKALIVAFRHHFSNYDLSESAIFEKYNFEIRSTVQEVRTCWGPTLPKFIKQGIDDITQLHREAARLNSLDLRENTIKTPLHDTVDDDDWLMQRFEIVDFSAYSIYQFRSSLMTMPERFLKEKNDIILTTNAKLMTKNGDMVRPQVVAVMELLLSGLEIEADFRNGYDALALSTNTKSNETLMEVKDFYKRFTSNDSVVSIPNAATQILSRVERRRDEVISMIDASNAHLIADHSRLEVLIASADKDIEEWNNLTIELVESTFKNAEDTFLKSLYPTPPPSPRGFADEEDDEEDEDRIGKLKAMLGLLPDLDFKTEQSQKKKEKRKVKKNYDEAPPKPSKLDKVRELQQGWLELDTVEGYIYYYNPTTGESLWELPESLKKPLKESEDETKFLDTPRDLLLENDRQKEFAPLHEIEYISPLASYPEIVMADVAEIARSVTDLSVDTAFEVTSVIRGAIRHFVRSPKPKSLREKELAAAPKASLMGLAVIPKTINVDRLLESNSRNDEVDDLGDIDNFDDNYAIEDDEEDDFDNYAQFDAAKEAGLLMLDDEYVLNLSREDQNAMSNEWLIAGLGGDFLANSIEAHNQAEKQKVILENRYRESRETDRMSVEDVKSRLLAEQRHNGYIEIFHHQLTELLSEPGLKQEELDHLVTLTKWIRKSAVAEVFAVHQVSWDRLQQIVKETLHAEMEAKALAERMRTEAGRERIRMMKEHQDDIDEMTNFFYSEAGLSKTNARRLSGEAIIRNVTTAKKMAKLWQRGDLDLMTLGLDQDDKDDIENSLRTLLMKPNPKNNAMEYTEMLQITNGVNNNPRYQEQAVVLRDVPRDVSNALVTVPAHADIHSASTRPPETGANRPLSRGRVLTPKDSFGLDPSLVTEVVEEYDVPDDESQIGGDSVYFSPSHSRSNRELGGYNSKPRTPERSHTFLQKDWSGYRSFRGGWIEGMSNDGHIYYYNTVSGESAWELPPGAHPIESSDSNRAKMHQPTQNYNSFLGHKHDNQDNQYQQQQLAIVPANSKSQFAISKTNQVSRIQKKVLKYGDRIPPRLYIERDLPLPVTPEVAAYSRYEGMARQLPLLKVQDQFQNYLVKSQFQISEAKANYLKYKDEIFDKVSKNVEAKLLKFLNEMKSLQKFCAKFTEESLKEAKELRRMLDDPKYYSPELVKLYNINTAKINDVVLAEKLSLILEALDKLKVNSKMTTEDTWSQIDKFNADWELIKAELLQSGDLYDEQQTNALESCRMTCEHAAKIFVYDISSSVDGCKIREMDNIRYNFRLAFLQDPKEEAARKQLRTEQMEYSAARAATKAQLDIEFANGWSHLVEPELVKLGYPPLVKEHLVKPEEEYVMSFLLRQVEMEVSLRDDYESIQEATVSLSQEMFEGIVLLDEQEKVTVAAGGSWFSKHRDTISRHSAALEKTLKIMKQKVADGYKRLCDDIQVIDYDIEKQAESTIAMLDSKARK